MYLLVKAGEYQKYCDLLDQSFRLRKKIFADRLGWSVSVSGPWERDRYDDHQPAYLLWCDDKFNQLYGCVRLMPTTGPTLLYDVFRDTFPDTCSLIGPGIWEGTRLCIDDEALKRDLPDLSLRHAFNLLLLALCEVALDNGIDTLVSNYEPYMRSAYRRAGVSFEELGCAGGFGRFSVCCGVFQVSLRVLFQMRQKINCTEPLYRRSPTPRTKIPVALPALV
ncbi:N-acyl-L-homoserine lactone (AHL) synthase [Ochrobactrum sp. 695/2009]|nr:N-acyl-L-homoserine lactone (AHL) synthase [Ochrobactrum sp. 721/2009]PJT15806.1 N-acyl-L-homoserine lactone (AHL) synthase [Ochrobactrum sp. 720/2009]PJT23979.1 N-acyl-L-homoserine lactone (AHL) synthase [Ochrobactrum sp. 715/2009]PJT24095.1 N-acyl-L-homoserine lactone (AHL) synthase [Ochrobactrum sp. 695/2009]PJT33692.1 N-acyl-L-homoserine lactone (AHL) synthase [Ochrobactrum sp. 689/2009]